MKARVLQTTDGKYIGQEFTLPPGQISLANITMATGGRFNPTSMKVMSNGHVRIVNSQYTAIVELF